MSRGSAKLSVYRAGANRGRRNAIATAIVAAVVVLIVVVAVGGYFVVSSTSKATSSQSQTSTTSQKTSSSETSSTTHSSASTASGLFPFVFSLQHASDALVSPGGYNYVVVLTISHSPGSGGEFVTLNSTSPAGITVQFSPSSPVALQSGANVNVTLDIIAASNATLGNETIGVRGTAGPYSQSASFSAMVVQYSVIMSPSTYASASVFYPSVLNVTVGSTVYWQNLDGPASVCGEAAGPGTGEHNVVFTTLPAANSPTMMQFQIYNYTFTSPGSYFYYSSLDTDHSMNGTINVLTSDGGVGLVPRMPTFSYFKNQNITASSTPSRTGKTFSPTELVLPMLPGGLASIALVLWGALSSLASRYLSEAGPAVVGGLGVLGLAIALAVLGRREIATLLADAARALQGALAETPDRHLGADFAGGPPRHRTES